MQIVIYVTLLTLFINYNFSVLYRDHVSSIYILAVKLDDGRSTNGT